MFKRFSNKHLGITLAVLAALYGLSAAFGGKKDRSFRKDLAVVDTSAVTKLIISLPGDRGEVELNKSASDWRVKRSDGKEFKASEQSVNTALGSLTALSATQLVSNKEGDWAEYKVDTAGTRVQAFQGNDKTVDLVLGKFEYKRTGMMNYVRLQDEDQTYLVKGYLSGTYDKRGDDWREKKLFAGGYNDWSRLTFSYPADSSFQIVKNANGGWMLPDSTELDGTKVRAYLSSLNSIQGNEFVENAPVGTALMRLNIEGPQIPIQVSAYSNEEYVYIVTSSMNPDGYFSGKAGNDMWKNIFVNLSKFINE